MIEGGAEVLSTVLRSGLFDRCSIYYAPTLIGGKTAPPIASGPETHGPEEAAAMELVALERLGEGYVATYTPRRRAVAHDGPAEKVP